jgi:hypothetical protein
VHASNGAGTRKKKTRRAAGFSHCKFAVFLLLRLLPTREAEPQQAESEQASVIGSGTSRFFSPP